LEVYDLQTGDLHQFGNEWGAAPVWSPDGQHLVSPELVLVGEEMVVWLVRIDVDGEQAEVISSGEEEPAQVRDEAPAWAPDGEWIAFGRQSFGQEHGTPGRQPWVMRPDGSGDHQLLTEPMADHFAFAWRPDGEGLAYVRSDLSQGAQPIPDVSVWFYGFSDKRAVLIAQDGVLPKWLP
jgi:Tol biopolymer transport system component